MSQRDRSKNHTFLAVLIVVIAGVAGWLWYAGGQPAASYVFTSEETGESITVSFDNRNDTATLVEGGGYANLVFEHAISASGARYVNDAEGLVLWNRGDEITIYRNDEPIFTGITASTFE